MATIQQTYELDLSEPFSRVQGRFLGIFPKQERKQGFAIYDITGSSILTLTPMQRRGHLVYSFATLANEELAYLDLGDKPSMVGGMKGGVFVPVLGDGGELEWDKDYSQSQEKQPGGAPYRFTSGKRRFLIANGAEVDTFDMIDNDRMLVADGRITRKADDIQIQKVTVNEYGRRLPAHLLVGVCWWRAQCRIPLRQLNAAA